MRRSVYSVSILGILAGCASLPTGPSVAVMPPPGKPFDLFVSEDRECRQFALQSIGGMNANQAAADSAVRSAAVGTAIGAAAGALAGGHEGAGSGAAFGMLAGAAIGSDQASYSGYEAQRRYDISYQQCMYAKGNLIPQAYSYQPRIRYYQPPPQPNYNAPPPQY